jgi:hypothetical protein
MTADGDARAHEESRADRPAKAHHGDLGLGQALAQPGFALDDRVFVVQHAPPETPRLMNAGFQTRTRAGRRA